MGDPSYIQDMNRFIEELNKVKVNNPNTDDIYGNIVKDFKNTMQDIKVSQRLNDLDDLLNLSELSEKEKREYRRHAMRTRIILSWATWKVLSIANEAMADIRVGLKYLNISYVRWTGPYLHSPYVHVQCRFKQGQLQSRPIDTRVDDDIAQRM